ncbi:verrucotoxin subunit beta-like protein [Labeo rohita]|uniref:Verrucotoxin subunit beta-like protein n=1 Tax=Labeo rohita TaxID=84645 RepID=A0A498LCV3_LABRO|nr:verrucotoxin subunit beta-like protein [Labeo rohita]
MDTQDSEEDVGTMKCERLRPDKETSPSPSVTTLQSDQSLDLQVLFKDGSQSFLGIKRSRQGQSTSPAPSVTSLQSDQSLDRPILFKDGAQSKKRRKRLRPDKGTSPAPSCTSLQSNESMDRPILFKDGTQSKERLRPDKGTSPAPSCTSLQSNESMDRPILFKDGTQSKKRLRPDKGTSPAPSCTSLQSNESMDRPILFKDRTQSKKRLRPDKGTSPAPSCTSLQSNESMDRPILFKDGTQSKKRLRPDKGTSPAPSCTSLQSNESMDRPILFKDGTQSIERLRPDKGTSPAPSCTSLQSNESMDRPILFKDGTQSKERLRPDKGTSPAPSCTSLQSNESMDRPILFKDGTQSSESIPEKNAEEPFDRHISFRNDTLSPDIRQHYSVPALQRHNLVEAIHLPDKEERKSPDEFGELTARVTELEATSKRLCKRFEIHCNDFPSDVIEMAALGHPLSLGMLYDSQKKSFCQGIFMWDEDTLARMKVSLPRPQTYVKVLENDSLQERFRVLEMSPVLQGVQTGQIKVSGASAFLNHPEQSQHQERATLHYRTTTRLDMLSQRLLQEAVPSALVGQTTATHVIIAVFFGAQAFFVFDGDRSNHEKNAAIVDVLKIMTSTFCPNHIISNLSATEKAKSSLLACSLYIDVGDWKSPVSFDKAVEVYGSLPTLLGSKDEQAVPLKVWLYPLKKLNKISMCAALSGVSENLIQRAESIMEHLRKQIRICQDIIKDYIHVNVIMQSQTLEDKLVGFLELLQEYQTTFQKGITDIVHIKEGKREKSLQDLLKRHSQSPFSAEKTDQWLENKETELKILNDFRAANITVVKSQAELQQIISHSQKTRVMCLTLYSPDVEDYFLTALRQYIESDHVIQNDSLQFRPVSISDKEIIKVQMFIAANEDAEQTKFIAALVTSDDFPEYSVQFYRDGRIASRNVTLGTKSGLVQISNIKHTSVSLKLNQPETKRIERYVVEYRALGDDGSNSDTWKQIVFDATIITETCIISDLKPGHQYQLSTCYRVRVSAVYEDITSQPSEETPVPVDVWNINLSKRKSSILLEVLKLQTEKKPVELIDWTDEESEVKGYLQCLPYISQLRFDRFVYYKKQSSFQLLVNLAFAASKFKTAEENYTEMFTSVCSYTSFPFSENYPKHQCDFLLDLYSHVKEYGIQTGRSVLPALQPIYQSAPAVWIVKLSERKSSILLEVLKLQTEKKPVELIDWTDEESEVKGFLQCLPYISQLRFDRFVYYKKQSSFQLLVNLAFAASKFKTAEENYTEMFTSVCSYTSFPFSENYPKHQCDFLLDLYSHVKEYGIQTGRSVLPALQPIYQSAPAVWIVKLSERKSSILLEVLKLQTEKKPVELIDWTDEENMLRGFFQCLPYISQLR